MMMADIAMHVLDIGMNSITSGADLITINLIETKSVVQEITNHQLCFEISDNGGGMSAEVLQKICDPFYTSRTTRKIGLGIPFIKAACELSNGSFKIESTEKVGTSLWANFDLSNIDCPPLGDIAEAIVTLMVYDERIEFIFTYKLNQASFVLDTKEVKAELDGVPLNEPSIQIWIKDYIKENIKMIKENQS